jgi:hypothetical protein
LALLPRPGRKCLKHINNFFFEPSYFALQSFLHEIYPMKNRITFMGLWLAMLVGLMVLPGFEARGLAAGVIIGYWPALLFRKLYEFDVLMLFLIMPLLSGATVFLCAWLIDKADGGAGGRILLIGGIMVSATYFSLDGIDYEQWQRTPAIQQAMASPEVDYQPTRSDFNKAIVLPRALAGGMFGLYLAAGLCVLAAIAKLGWYRARRNSIKPTPGDEHGRAPSPTTETN